MGAPVRKADHLRLAARADVLHLAGPGLEHLRLRHRALPGRDLDDVELGCELLGRRLRAPLLVSAMTGRTGAAQGVNDRLARAAADEGAAAVGMARPLLVAAREDRASAALATIARRLRIATWAGGAASPAALGPEHLR
jgi:isopentenyl-diphosphate delta-isomerase